MKDFKEFIDRENAFFKFLKTESGTTEFKSQAYSLVEDLMLELAITRDQLYNTKEVLINQLDITEKQAELLTKPIDEIEGLSTRTKNCLRCLKIRLVSDLLSTSKTDIFENSWFNGHGYGPVTKKEILELLTYLEAQGFQVKE